MKSKTKMRLILYVSICVYLLIIAMFAVFLRDEAAQSNGPIFWYVLHASNLIPVKGIIDMFYNAAFNHNIRLLRPLLDNILVLFPVGFLIGAIDHEKMPHLGEKSATCALFTAYMALLALARLLMRRGSFDIDDIILNFIGIALGIFLGCFLAKLCERRGVTMKIAE